MHLEPLRAQPLKEQVVQQLMRLMQEGALQPAQQLPSERELSKQLQVSRGTVREAVQFLHALGLVEIRHGSGTFVRASSGDRKGLSAEWRRWTLRHAGRIHELLEVRKGLESLAAERAAERAAGGSLAGLSEAIDQMAAAVAAKDVALLVQADVLFHYALYEASGNDALVELADAIGKQLLRERAATWDLPGRPERSLNEHQEIYDAVREGDVARARAAVLAHLKSIEHDLAGLAVRQADGERDRA
ncbi:MAG: FadR/GntR family transcriptional regulator [Thermoleophilaceae bacterium]